MDELGKSPVKLKGHDTLTQRWFNVWPASQTVAQHYGNVIASRVVLSEAVDGCICSTRKIQHGGD